MELARIVSVISGKARASVSPSWQEEEVDARLAERGMVDNVLSEFITGANRAIHIANNFSDIPFSIRCFTRLSLCSHRRIESRRQSHMDRYCEIYGKKFPAGVCAKYIVESDRRPVNYNDGRSFGRTLGNKNSHILLFFSTEKLPTDDILNTVQQNDERRL